MSPTLAFILALLATHAGLKVNLQVEKDDIQQMQEREEYLHQEMARLLQEIEGSSGIMESMLSSALQQQWVLWVSAAALALVLLVLGCWLLSRRKHGSASCREAVIKKLIIKKGLPSTKVLKELVDELLGVCRVLSQRSFMPELHLAAGTDTSPEACGLQEKCSTYRPLVILQPPPGHSFSLESTEQPPARRIRVVLECLCPVEQVLGQTCFLHASGGQLSTDQVFYLLDTLCTGWCLDKEKVTRWVQMLVASAWLHLPHSRHCQLTALPSHNSCCFQLHSSSGLHCHIEMVLAVQQGSSGAYLSLE